MLTKHWYRAAFHLIAFILNLGHLGTVQLVVRSPHTLPHGSTESVVAKKKKQKKPLFSGTVVHLLLTVKKASLAHQGPRVPLSAFARPSTWLVTAQILKQSLYLHQAWTHFGITSYLKTYFHLDWRITYHSDQLLQSHSTTEQQCKGALQVYNIQKFDTWYCTNTVNTEIQMFLLQANNIKVPQITWNMFWLRTMLSITQNI